MSLRAHNLCQENDSIVNYTNRLLCEHDTFLCRGTPFLEGSLLWWGSMWMNLEKTAAANSSCINGSSNVIINLIFSNYSFPSASHLTVQLPHTSVAWYYIAFMYVTLSFLVWQSLFQGLGRNDYKMF